jgi:hypothetical protein
MNVFLKTWRRLHRESHVRMQIACTERKLHDLHTVRMGVATAEQRERARRLEGDRHEYCEWQLEIEDKALLKRAAKIGVYPDEVVFPETKDDRNMGRYHYSGTFGNELLRDEFRQPFVKAIREREPLYRKERREQIELTVKVIAALTAAITGIIGALIGLYAIRK